jgi:solute carrier family 35 protein E2
LDGDAFSLGTNQLVISVISGFIQLQFINKFQNPLHRNPAFMKNIFRDMVYIGAFRCVTIILGLIALKYIAVSFVATIKSSSPLFTVLISRIILKERTSKILYQKIHFHDLLFFFRLLDKIFFNTNHHWSLFM